MFRTLKTPLQLTEKQKGKLIASCVLSLIGTALGLVPYILIYLIILELFNTVINQAYVWMLVFWSITAIVLRFGFIGLSGTFFHIAAYAILYDLKIKLAWKLDTLYSRYWEKRKKARGWKIAKEGLNAG